MQTVETDVVSKGQVISGGYVLIVSADRGFLDYYRNIFVGLGFMPMVRTSYEAAIACLRLVVFDFVVVDQGNLTFEGRYVLEQARELDPRTTVLVVARRPDHSCCLEALELGAADYLQDPVPIHDMVRIVAGQSIANQRGPFATVDESGNFSGVQ